VQQQKTRKDFMFFVNLFITFIYQPFLNVLIFFYWVDSLITRGHPDMGIAVVFLTIIIRIILLPVSLAEEQSEKERREFAHVIADLEVKYAHDPITLRAETKKLFHRNRKVVAAEIFSFFLQVAISLMLWKMFSTGLEGQDLPLIYHFMPKVATPFNLVFLGKFDLSRTNVFLNFLQSVMIFVVETASIMTSPYPPMKGEVVRLQLVLPVVSFLVFMFLPAGKKLFIITALVISLIITMYKYGRRRWQDYKAGIDEAAAAAAKQAKLAEQAELIQQFHLAQKMSQGDEGADAAQKK
jgi:YidC/Oxa1 family membrane protein insertase